MTEAGCGCHPDVLEQHRHPRDLSRNAAVCWTSSSPAGGRGTTPACRVANNHTNIIYMERDGDILRELPVTGNAEDNLQDKSVLNVQDIITFAETVPLDNIRPTVGRQIEKNTAIAAEGLRNSWGANIGSTLLESSQDWATQARAWRPPARTHG